MKGRRGACAQATRRLVNMRWRMGMRDGVAMTPPQGGAAKVRKVERTDPAEPLVPLVAAPVPAAAVPAFRVPATGADELGRLHGRRMSERDKRAPDNDRLGAAGQQRPSEPQTDKDAQRRVGHGSSSSEKGSRPPQAARNDKPQRRRLQRFDADHFLLCASRNALAQPALVSCRPRATASASASTGLVMTEPEPT